MIDLHIHFPMRLLGGVEAPRDVVEGMTRVARPRGRQAARGGAGDRRAAVQLPPLGRDPGASRRSCSQHGERDHRLQRALPAVLARWTSTSRYGAPPESAYYAKLIELLDAAERGGRAQRRHVIVRDRARTSSDSTACASCTASRAASTSAPRRSEVTAHVHELADRGVLYITLAHLFWRRVATNAPALPFLPDAVYNLALPAGAGRRAVARSARPRCGRCTSAGCWSTSATCARTRSRRRSR